MPSATNVVLLLGLLAHLSDHGIAIDRSEEPIDVNLTPVASKSQVLLRCQVLLAKEDDPIVVIGVAHLSKLLVAEPRGKIHPVDLGPERARDRLHLNSAVMQVSLHSAS